LVAVDQARVLVHQVFLAVAAERADCAQALSNMAQHLPNTLSQLAAVAHI
jgi:hypothetical protein